MNFQFPFYAPRSRLKTRWVVSAAELLFFLFGSFFIKFSPPLYSVDTYSFSGISASSHSTSSVFRNSFFKIYCMCIWLANDELLYIFWEVTHSYVFIFMTALDCCRCRWCDLKRTRKEKNPTRAHRTTTKMDLHMLNTMRRYCVSTVEQSRNALNARSV